MIPVPHFVPSISLSLSLSLSLRLTRCSPFSIPEVFAPRRKSCKVKHSLGRGGGGEGGGVRSPCLAASVIKWS